MSGPVGAYDINRYMITQAQELKTQRADLSRQQATGLAADNYVDMGPKIMPYISVTNELTMCQQYKTNIGQAQQRVLMQQNTLQSLMNDLIKLKPILMQAANGGTMQVSQAQAYATNNLSSLQSAMAQRVNGEYIFGGTQTDQIPYNASTPVNFQNGTYYTGSLEQASFRVSPTQTMTCGITANDSAIQNMFAAYQNLALSGTPQTIQQTQNAVDAAITALTNTQFTIDQQANNLDVISANTDNAIELLGKQQNDINGVDMDKVVVDAKNIKNSLYAIFGLMKMNDGTSLSDLWR